MASVLIVDDAVFMRATIKQILEANGHSVAGEASTGVEAIEKFAELKPDVVIMDITMPKMGGIDALKRIKVLDPNAKIIICSAIGQQDKIAESIQCGAQEFIVKPFAPSLLVRAMERVMAQREQ